MLPPEASLQTSHGAFLPQKQISDGFHVICHLFFALTNLLQDSAVRGVVIGCSRPEHVLEAVKAADISNSL